MTPLTPQEREAIERALAALDPAHQVCIGEVCYTRTILDAACRYLALAAGGAPAGKPRCPDCGGPVHPVPRSPMLNEEQRDSVKAGGYYCETCPDDNGRGKSGLHYVWRHEALRVEGHEPGEEGR